MQNIIYVFTASIKMKNYICQIKWALSI